MSKSSKRSRPGLASPCIANRRMALPGIATHPTPRASSGASSQPTVLSLFSGMGGGLLGFIRAGFRSVGAIDCDPAAIRDLEYLTGAKGTVGDLSTMSPNDLRAICPETPDCVFSSPPCKSFSGCLPDSTARKPQYQDLSALAFRGIWLALEAWERKPKLVIIENVPRIMSRGRKWLDEIEKLLNAYGYAVERSTHDCGEIGGLAQRRHRFLLVARHREQVPEYLRVPPKKRLRSVGEVLGDLPLPLQGSEDGGRLHELPKLSSLNWVRLASIPAGGDWRDLPERVALTHRPARQNGGFGCNDWERPAHTVVGEGTVRNTWASVCDPRLAHSPFRGSFGVVDWGGPSPTIRGNQYVRQAPAAIADPRIGCKPRAGVYGVISWGNPAPTVIGEARHDNGRYAVADPRVPTGETTLDLESRRPCHLLVLAEDGTWHRPLTTLELAVLQGFPAKVNGEWLQLDGNAKKDWRQRIGNAVPPPAAEAIARNCLATLAAAANGLMLLSNDPIWVAPDLEHEADLHAAL